MKLNNLCKDEISKYYKSSDKAYEDFLYQSFGDKLYEKVIEFTNKLGVETKDINGYVYPASFQASSFVWALNDALKDKNVDIMLKTEVTDINKMDEVFCISTSKEKVFASKVLVASGGKSYKALGASDSGYNFAKKLGHNVNDVRPALCGMLCKEVNEELSGVRANARAYLCVTGEDVKTAKTIGAFEEDIQAMKANGIFGEDTQTAKVVGTEEGELQFTEGTISGIMIFNLSSECGGLLEQNIKPCIVVDFLSDWDVEDVVLMLLKNGHRTILGNMNAYVNDKLALHIIKKAEINPKHLTSSMTEKELKELVQKFKAYRFNIDGLKDFENAQVCAGGVSIDELDINFKSLKQENLYFAGEVVDIDGICGGYNITFALLSGIKVGLDV